MKICFFNSDFPPRVGGIATFNWSLAYHMSLDKNIEHVQVISFKSLNPGQENYNRKLSIIRLPKVNFLFTFRKICGYFFEFRNYDVFHATNIFPVGFLAVLIGRFVFRKPIFVTFHGTDVLSAKASRKTKLAKYFTLKWASKSIAISFSTLKEAVKYYNIDPENFSVIYYALNRQIINKDIDLRKKTRDKYHLAEDDFIILTVANLVKRKGIADLIKTVSFIDNSKIKLVIVGKGPERESLENLVKELKLKNRVVFTGLVDEVNPFYASADIFVLPSYFIKEEGDIEGLGIVFLEAQQYGLPVIGTNSGGIPEAIDNGKSGFIVPERDTEVIKEKILTLINNKNLCVQMGKRAQQFVLEKFDWTKSIKKYLALYKSKL